MPKSIRLNRQLEEKLDRASSRMQLTHSEFIREAVAEKCDKVLGSTLADVLTGSLGLVHSQGGRAKETGRSFRRLLADKKK